jgi:serine/threonine-protein kinase
VADFGIARALSGYSGQTGTNMVVGTPQYFAPEQARAKPLDGRADIYSLGVTLYRAATGRLPFEGDDWYEIARQHVEEPPPAPRSINPDLTPGFEAAILHCLQKQPDDRPATGELLAQELVALLPATLETSAYRTRVTGSEPTVVVRSDGYPAAMDNGTAPKRSSSTPWIAGALLIAGLTVGASIFSRWRSGDAAPPPVRPADSAAAVTSPPTSPPVAPPVTETLPPKDTAPRPVRNVGSLLVEAPDNATVTISSRGQTIEQAVGNGWRSDSLRPGSYDVSGSVPAPSGCPTATTTQSVVVRATAKVARVRLSPRSCAVVSFDAAPKGSRYVLTSLTAGDSLSVRRGTIPADRLLLPVGEYSRVITHEGCVDYADTVRVGVAEKLPKRTLFCR